MTQTTPWGTPAARKMADKLIKSGSLRGHFNDVYSFQHYSFSRAQKSLGAWKWELLNNGKSTGIGSNYGVRELLREPKLEVSSTGNVQPYNLVGKLTRPKDRMPNEGMDYENR